MIADAIVRIRKPLQWIETGKVTSRRRKTDNPPKIYTVRSRDKPQAAAEATELNRDPPCGALADNYESIDSSLAQADYLKEVVGGVNWPRAFTLWKPTNEENWGYLAETLRTKVLRELALQQAAIAGEVDRIFQIGGRSRMEDIVARGSREEAAELLKSEREPLKRLERLVRFMQAQDLPHYDYLANDTSEVVQAVQYCESHDMDLEI